MLGPERKPFVPAMSIFALGRGIGFGDGSETADSESDNEPDYYQHLFPGFAMTHSFPVYVERMSQWSNGVSLLHQEP
jgi:hypothetical protein